MLYPAMPVVASAWSFAASRLRRNELALPPPDDAADGPKPSGPRMLKLSCDHPNEVAKSVQTGETAPLGRFIWARHPTSCSANAKGPPPPPPITSRVMPTASATPEVAVPTTAGGVAGSSHGPNGTSGSGGSAGVVAMVVLVTRSGVGPEAIGSAVVGVVVGADVVVFGVVVGADVVVVGADVVGAALGAAVAAGYMKAGLIRVPISERLSVCVPRYSHSPYGSAEFTAFSDPRKDTL